MKELINWRVISFYIISTLPLQIGLIGCGFLWAKEIVRNIAESLQKEERRKHHGK
ncbi:hypothetical protein J6W78_04365 [bacterium]|nr:hypothetical protein [bacterium]